ncbi:hypothetical protein L9F63_019499, partial [Diploptera punctata]
KVEGEMSAYLVKVKQKHSGKGQITLGRSFFHSILKTQNRLYYKIIIFKIDAGSQLEPSTSTIIVGAIQVIATFVSTLVVDRLGRRKLLILSDCIMAICALLLGVFFYLKDAEKNDTSSYGWLPLLSVCLFIVVFSLGFGPIPWMMIGELFPPQIKGIASSLSCLLNWFLAFLVTKFYQNLVNEIHAYTTFWIFAGVSALGTVLVFLFLPETKGKTMEEIQRDLGSEPAASSVENGNFEDEGQS